jgi:glycerol-3-phosphate acyltransferase PlsY
VLIVAGETAAGVLFALLAALLWMRHSANISRLVSGAEGKIGGKG